MRVIGGAARGRRLKVPKSPGVRPTAARVKESLFNILPHDFTGLSVLDLFAGSGNVSIEALSRGALKAVLIDESPRATAVIRDNLNRLGFSERAQVWTAPVFRSLRRLAKAGETFDLVFLDPPYDRELVGTALKAIGQCELLRTGGRVVVEHSAREAVKSHYGSLYLNDQRRYGDTQLSFFKKEMTPNPAV
jgi:16S rRNA (guanine966-N2)-methyltransferase